MGFNYKPKVDKKEDELKKQTLAKMPTLKTVSKTTPVATPTVQNNKPTVASPYSKDFKPVIPTFAPAEALAKKFLGSATLGLTDVIKTPYTESVEAKAQTMPIASTVASVGGYLVPGAAGTKLVKPLLKNVGNKLGKQVLEGAIVGTGITASENVAPLLTGQKDIKQVGTDVTKGLIGGAVLDVGLFKLGKLAKPLLSKIKSGIALSQAEKQTVAQALNVSVDNVDEAVGKLRLQQGNQFAATTFKNLPDDATPDELMKALADRNKVGVTNKPIPKLAVEQPTVKPLLQATEVPTPIPFKNVDISPTQTVKPLIGDSAQFKDIAASNEGFSTTIDIPNVKADIPPKPIDLKQGEKYRKTISNSFMKSNMDDESKQFFNENPETYQSIINENDQHPNLRRNNNKSQNFSSSDSLFSQENLRFSIFP